MKLEEELAVQSHWEERAGGQSKGRVGEPQERPWVREWWMGLPRARWWGVGKTTMVSIQSGVRGTSEKRHRMEVQGGASIKDKAGFVLPMVHHSGPPLKGLGSVESRVHLGQDLWTQPAETSPFPGHLSLQSVLWEVRCAHCVLTGNKQWAPCLGTLMGLKSYTQEGLAPQDLLPSTLPPSLHPDMIIQKEQSRWNVGSAEASPHPRAWVHGRGCRLGELLRPGGTLHVS